MKKLVISLGIICMLALSASDIMGQTPVSRTNTSSAAAGKSQSTAVRQERKGDAQMSKANTNYQRAQTSAARPAATTQQPSAARPAATTTTTRPTTTARPATTPASRTATNSSASSARTNTSSTTVTRPASSSTSVNRQAATNSAQPAATSASRQTGTSSATAKPASTATATQASARETANASSAATTARGTAPSSTSESRRGYNGQGVAQPQPAPQGYTGGGASGDPKMHHNPFMHPNHHNFGGHMTVPRHIQPVYYGGIPYYYYNSVFCTMLNGYYVICRPPLGAVIAYSIFHTWHPVIVVHRGVSYYYDDGTFFRPRQRDYVVVAPPVGALVAELPSNYQTIVLEGRVYYKVDNVYYKEVVLDGYLWYEVLFVA